MIAWSVILPYVINKCNIKHLLVEYTFLNFLLSSIIYSFFSHCRRDKMRVITIPIFSANLFISCVRAFVIVYLLFICNLFLFIFSSLHLYSIYFIFLFMSWYIMNSCCFLVSYWLFYHTCFFLFHFHSVLVLSSDDKYRILSKHAALFSFFNGLIKKFSFLLSFTTVYTAFNNIVYW